MDAQTVGEDGEATRALREELAEWGRHISEVERLLRCGRSPEAVEELHTLERVLQLHFDHTPPPRDELNAASVPTRELVRGLLWAAHASFRYGDADVRTTVYAVGDLRKVLAQYGRRLLRERAVHAA